MGTKIEYVDTTHLYATKYIRNSKAIAVLWAIFTICYAIIGIVAFVTPEWIGDPDNESAGRLGLWQVCQKDEIYDSSRRLWENIFTVPTFSFQLATFFMAGAVALALLTICFLVFVMFMKSTKVFHICGWMQIISALCMIVACVAFPFGWNSDEFRKICGPDANRFELGLCDIRWAYPLAIIGCVDGVILATLAFILATRHVRLQPDPLYQNSLYKALCMIVACVAFPFGWNSDEFRKICGPDANRFELGLCDIRWAYPLAIIGCVDGVILATLAFILATRHVRLQPDPLYQNSLYKGEINNAYITDAVSLAGSRKSLNLQPILLVAPPHNIANGDDTISQFSSRTPNHRYNRPDYHNSMHQF